MESLAYLLTVLLSLSAWVAITWLAWQGVELVYRLYCKATGREY
jgi:hypothetical protein